MTYWGQDLGRVPGATDLNLARASRDLLDRKRGRNETGEKIGDKTVSPNAEAAIR